MTSRAHLSIGEVLSLLQDDFPDLTITKIRFLESQGLIDPERTPSGYRKFYEFDIERLRWILRQQREHFLPLKVIKGRLDGADGVAATNGSGGTEQALLSLGPDSSEPDPPPVWMADHARATATAPATAPSPKTPAPKTPAPKTATPKTAAPETVGPKTTAEKATAAVTDIVEEATTDTEANGAPAMASTPPSTPPTSTPTTPAPPTTTPSAVPPVVAPLVPTGLLHKKEAPMAKPAKPNDDTVRRPLDLGVTGVSMNLAELAKASGLTETQLGELEEFGLINPDLTGPEPIYGEEALVAARHASTFFSLGVEARHLRIFKVSADREAGLLEQLILPLLKQRNPAARQQAIENLDRLAAAGTGLQAALLHLALRPHLGTRA